MWQFLYTAVLIITDLDKYIYIFLYTYFFLLIRQYSFKTMLWVILCYSCSPVKVNNQG